MLTLGSLFDGIGGFPLSGIKSGIRPVWASEIEPFPILVTKTRFPDMKHLGSVTDIKGDQIEPVDIITFGSPCQDLSVAGKQAGIHDGARSNLFFEAVRIIKEMREHDRANGRTGFDARPRFAVWENVPGAFSSGKGKDFQAVLQTLCEVSDPNVSIPLSEGGWSKSGCVVGKGYSVAWRTYDAQYWGVPQRRKRIYLVADFASERAGEILFESEGVSGNPETSREAREGTSQDAEGSIGGSSLFEPHSLMEENWSKQNTKNALRAQASKSSHVVVGGFMGGMGAKARTIGYIESATPTIRSVMSGGNTIPDAVYPNVARTLTSEADASFCINRGQNVLCYGISPYASNAMLSSNPHSGIYEAKTSRTLDLNGGNPACNQRGVVVAIDCRNISANNEISTTIQVKNNGGHSLNYVNPVVYDARGNGEGGVSPTLTGDHENRITDYTAVAVCAGNDQLNQISMAEQSNTLDCMHDQQIVLTDSKPPRKYIVRRLTPLECCRLQGYPDGWTENVAIENPTEEQVTFFTEVWERWASINGTKPKSRAQVIKWLGDPRSDSAEYKAYGNSLAIPCSADVLGRIARAMEVNNDGHRPIDANALMRTCKDFYDKSENIVCAYDEIDNAPTLSLNTLRDAIYQDAVAHGLWEESDKMAKEAAEDGEEGYPGEKELIEKFFKWHEAAQLIFFEGDEMLTAVEDYKWDSATEELADVVIMAMSAAGYLGIDIDAAIRRKMEINKGRPWKHGRP